MKHLFWIVSGVLVLGILITWFMVVPTAQAQASKKALDRQAEELKDLEKRAKRGDPSGVFDAVNIEDTKRLETDYLITEQWSRVLDPHVQGYQGQLTDIRNQLFSRAAYLAQPVSQSKDQFTWYTTYRAQRDQLITRLLEAGCLARSSATTQAEYCQTLSLLDRESPLPTEAEQPLLTTQLRALELVTERLIAARVALTDNPLVGQTGLASQRAQAAAQVAKAAFASNATSTDAGLRTLTTVLSKQVQVRSVGISLRLQGPPSTLFAACAGLERNANPTQPLIAVTSASFNRAQAIASGARLGVDDQAELAIELEILVFSPLPVPAGEK